MPDNIYDQFHVVLVEPQESLNVGSVARAMANLGFRNLHLVAPRGYDPARARVTACWAEHLLDSLTIHDHYEDALAPVQEVVGFAMRADDTSPHFTTLPQWADALPHRPVRTTALVFGPEDNGLRREHLEPCRFVVRIPSRPECPSFNLAQSVLLALYDITRALLPEEESELSTGYDAPTQNEQHQLLRLVDSVMQESGFVRPGTPTPVPEVVRNLFHRLEMNRHEMGVLLGLFGRVNTALRRAQDNND